MQQDAPRLSLRTLAIASVASAAAAAITSQFWIRGTPIAAALTPLIVALVSELLHRPTDKLAERLTAETDALPEAAGAAPPPASAESDPSPDRAQPPTPGEAPRRGDAASEGRPEFTVYRSEGRLRRRRIAWVTVLGTGLLGFLIAAAVLTIPEALSGKSLFNDRQTTLGGSQRGDSAPATTPTDTVPAETETETVTETTTNPVPPEQRRTPSTTETTTTPTTTAPERAPPPTTTPDSSATPSE